MYDYAGVGWTQLILGVVIVYALMALFLVNLRDLLRAVRAGNRRMAPNLVWLNLVPLVMVVWMFVTMVAVWRSARAELKSRGLPAQGDAAFGVGLLSGVLFLAYGVLGQFLPRSMIGLYMAVFYGLIVCWVGYWVLSSRMKHLLRATMPPVAPSTERPAAVVEPAEPRCPACGLLALPDDEHCRSCGYDLSTSAETPDEQDPDGSAATGHCPFCGAAYRPDAKFCSTCGRASV